MSTEAGVSSEQQANQNETGPSRCSLQGRSVAVLEQNLGCLRWCPSLVCLLPMFSMAIIYGVFSASNLITPSVVTVVGPQLSMFASGLFYR